MANGDPFVLPTPRENRPVMPPPQTFPTVQSFAILRDKDKFYTVCLITSKGREIKKVQAIYSCDYLPEACDYLSNSAYSLYGLREDTHVDLPDVKEEFVG